MTNQTVVAVPPNIEDPAILKRFLLRLVEELDIVLGYRGDNGYVSQTDLEEGTTNLSKSISEAVEGIDNLETLLAELRKALAKLDDRVKDNEDDLDKLGNALTHETLGASYRDFNHADWATFTGNGEFSDLGSNISNAPYTVVPGDTYYNFVWSATTTNGGVVQRLIVQHLATIAVYQRAGNTWTDVTTIGWLAL